MIPLSMATAGKYKVIQIKGGHKFNARLNELGILEEDIIEVLTNAPGPIFVKKGDTKVGIGVGMASKIFVQPLS